MIGFDEALALVAEAAKPLGVELVPLERAAGRILAAPVRAAIDAPRADVSAMDGYAVRDADLPGPLRVIGDSRPGTLPAGAPGPGECLRIFTGAPLPQGADRVVIQEIVRREGAIAVVDVPPGPERFVRRRGSDFAAGNVLLEAGRRLDPRALVAAAAADQAELIVARRPRLAILATGDELAAPGTAHRHEGAIPESVTLGVAALAGQWGAETIRRLRLGDDLAALKRTAAELLEEADLIVVTGGASVGARDFAKAMFEDEGLVLLFAGVAIRPGRPAWFGRARGRLVLGLPGNPSSALVTARLLLAPLLAGLGGGDPAEALYWRPALLAASLPANGTRETFVRARGDNGAARPLDNQDSSAQHPLAAADFLVRRPVDAPAAAAGDTVQVLDF